MSIVVCGQFVYKLARVGEYAYNVLFARTMLNKVRSCGWEIIIKMYLG